MKILNFGSCNIDYVYSLDHIVHPGETESCCKLEIFPGGKGLNQSIAVARAGAEVYHAGCVGSDGEFLTEVLRQSGVRTELIQTVAEKNGHAVIQVSRDGENSIFLYPGSNEQISEEYADSVLKHFANGDLLLLQNEINNMDYIIRRANEIGMQIVLNPSPYNEKIANVDLNRIAYLILNEIELKSVSGKTSAEDGLTYLKERFPKLKVMLTLGKNGCIYQDETRRIYHPIFRTRVVDTTAAGDTFTGYFAAGIAAGKSYREILKTASCASAVTVSGMGAAPSVPTMAQVREQLKILQTEEGGYKDRRMLTRIEDYIDENMATASLGELASALGYSAVYTGKLLKKLTGQTFKAFLVEKRLRTAEQLLLETELSVREIIEKVGYKNESFFRNVFKEKYGKNPLEFRRNGKRA